jgi:hypothetical protein
LNLEGVEFASVFRRFGEGSSGEVGEADVGEEAAALCINFMVRSREDIDFGTGPGVLVEDILVELKAKAHVASKEVVWFVN